MKKILLLVLISLIALSSCQVSPPNPIVGYYRFSPSYADERDNFALALTESQKFFLIQFRPNNTVPYIWEGTYSIGLSSFNFVKADGTIILKPSSCSQSIEADAVLKLDVENHYNFYWSIDKDSAEARLDLESRNQDVCKDIAFGYSMTEKRFQEYYNGAQK